MIDLQLKKLAAQELKRQREGIELIPSENYASSAVRKLLASYFVNKYSEGYPYKRYYGGNEVVDEVETLAQERAKKLFQVVHANVQPYSGSPANLAVYLAICNPGDVIMGQALTAGGHLTHGHHVSATGIFFKSVPYFVKSQVGPKEDLFDFAAIRQLAKKHRPKLIWVGGTAHPLVFNYQKFAQIADEVGAYLAADIAHIAGLIAAGVHPSPAKHVHIITTTTHKTLRGPRGGIIMVTAKGINKDPQLPQKIDKAVFPGLQGGPHDNQTAAIAMALFEAQQPSFKKYAVQIVKNSQALASVLIKGGLKLIAGRSENHLLLVDLTPIFGPGGGIFVQQALDRIGLTLNKNTIPTEPSSPFYPSGVRLGTPAMTTRGMKAKDMQFIGKKILETINEIKHYRLPADKEERKNYLLQFKKEIWCNRTLAQLRKQVRQYALCFPLP
jgi:glycine hydroxymethyltransferase